MKLIYLAKDSYNNRYKSLCRSLGIDTIQYKNPLKAVDNLIEIEPAIIYMVKDDFPRFWKIVLSSLRDLFNESETVFILEGEMDEGESKEFSFLKGSNLIYGDSGLNQLKELILKVSKRAFHKQVYYPESGELCLGFVKQDDFSFVSGHISEITDSEIEFIPDNSEDLVGLLEKNKINDVSLSHGDVVVNLNLEISQVSDHLHFIVNEPSKDYVDLISALFV